MKSREIRLASRPRGWPTTETFELAEVDVPPLSEGQVLVRNLFMSVDPYMRGRMNAARSYVAPFEVGQVMPGDAIGEVVESKAAGFEPGAHVRSLYGWREYFVADTSTLRVVDSRVKPLSAYLGALGAPGLTAWIGLDLAGLAPGERIFVSGAAGAVGHIAGQLAKLRGCFVVGSAGSPEKVRVLVEELGFDAAIPYKEGDLVGQLKRAAPDGFEVYFDNVGGDHLEAAFTTIRPHGRVIACGAISRYNDETPPPGPRNLMHIVSKRLTIRGFIVLDHLARMREFKDQVLPLLVDGRLKAKETVVAGLDQAPRAFLDMLRGANIGKMVVKL
jgi:NADPH-dependent curcumin reductase CurA